MYFCFPHPKILHTKATGHTSGYWQAMQAIYKDAEKKRHMYNYLHNQQTWMTLCMSMIHFSLSSALWVCRREERQSPNCLNFLQARRKHFNSFINHNWGCYKQARQVDNYTLTTDTFSPDGNGVRTPNNTGWRLWLMENANKSQVFM